MALSSCRSPEEYVAEADADVYALVAARRAALVADPDAFSIAPPEDSLRQRILVGIESGAAVELPPLRLSDCLAIAYENNRDAAERRESLYRAALDLTLERWRFGWQPSATASGDLNGSLEESTSWSADADLGLTRLLGSGARVVAGIGLGLFENLLTNDGVMTNSSFNLSVAQPLLRGFGSKIVTEPLTQAERTLLYEVRSYERFRRTFAFDVASRYLRLLQQVDGLANELANAESVKRVSERNKALAEAGRLNDIELDQARQNELSATSRVIDAQQGLDSQLDDFKFFLGLPIEFDLQLDVDELGELVANELEDLDFDEEEAIAIALLGRYDHLNAIDRVDDAERRADIARDGLRAGLGLVGSIGGTSQDDQPLDYGSDAITWNLGLDLDLPVDQIPERNAYRSALITLEATRRAAGEFADNITVGVRDALRDLISRSETFRIQDRSVQLAERRVESSSRNLEAGRAQTRDLLESQDSLLSARNARTRALIDFRLAELALWRDLEVLAVEEDGVGVDTDALFAAREAVRQSIAAADEADVPLRAPQRATPADTEAPSEQPPAVGPSGR
ncbi:Outer membrane efflux protein [Planctomycetes bacterium Pla163]|uniref:Outer membrane efflux protein n=1 Tax=Rohdeia mirabilis TaxID=2528008 RepID=A0A518D2K6_9BACT|nr:Outer membrane efflux protein [Planctomycetes bacterium Pla163]